MARAINTIIIHCSATPNGREVSAEEIDHWHRDRGFRRQTSEIGFNEPTLKHIGYHYTVHPEGYVRVGRGEREVGAHVRGHNRRSIGICVIGTDQFNQEQWEMLSGLVRGLLQRYPNAKVVGHRDLSPDKDGDGTVEPHEWLKTCPGFDVQAWVESGMKPLPENVLDGPA